jgi:hypothetical protein
MLPKTLLLTSLLLGHVLFVGARTNKRDGLLTAIRRKINLGSTFGSVSSSKKITPYDRVTGQPVFAVTTSWGSPYMTMEKVTQDETIPISSSINNDNKKKPTSLSEEQVEYRRVALYFLDPADAVAVHNEMLQQPGDSPSSSSSQQQQPDIRITAFSLAKALRQASILGYGVPTGAPPDPLNGRFNIEEGATLRYKLVPSKKQLYYAARCIGRERVGLCSSSGSSSTPTTGAKEDAINAIIGNSALEAANLARRREQRERKIPTSKQMHSKGTEHMVGYSGIPVFYCPNLQRPVSPVQQVMTGLWTRRRYEVPLFFNYEDLTIAWDRVRSKKNIGNKVTLSEDPPDVEVFNLWDVVTSMDRYQNTASRRSGLVPWKIFGKKRQGVISQAKSTPLSPTLEDIIFVPNSDCVYYKDAISRRGNGKMRLRPMRESIYKPLR